MLPGEVPAKCHLCQSAAESAELLLVAVVSPINLADLLPTTAPRIATVVHESRYVPLCWHHKIKRRATSEAARFVDVLVMPDGKTGRIDRGRAGGDVLCPTCDRKFYDHPECPGFPFLNVLCDGSVVKL